LVSDWSSDVCSSDLPPPALAGLHVRTGNLHGELLSVHKISQAYPGIPTVRERLPAPSPNLRVEVDGSAAAAQPGVAADRLVDKPLGALHGGGKGEAACQAGGDGGRIRAPGSMGVVGGHGRGGEIEHYRAVVENVGGV